MNFSNDQYFLTLRNKAENPYVEGEKVLTKYEVINYN